MLRALVLALLVAVVVPATAGAVARGRDVPAGEAPWYVAFPGMSATVCGGVLVAPDRILTAAHCVQGVAPARLRPRVGDEQVRATVDRVVFPRTYRLIPSPVAPDDPNASGSLRDIAVLRLTAPVAGVAPIAVASAPPADGEATTTYGRGRTSVAGGTPRALQAADQVVLAASACGQPYGGVLEPALHLCTEDASATRAQACAGDSGGPVVVRRDGVAQLVGLVTWGGEVRGRGCGEGLPDVSERVAPYAQLIGTDFASAAPYAERRTRVRRVRGRLECVSGPWRGAPRLTSTWYRTARRGGMPVDVAVPGLRGKRVAARSVPLGCTVTARGAGGWAEERSYNQR